MCRQPWKAKLGVDFHPYVILGACNPNLAYQGLLAEPELGLLLPCNVIVYDTGDGATIVSIVDPIEMLDVAGNPKLEPIAAEANERLHRVLRISPTFSWHNGYQSEKPVR